MEQESKGRWVGRIFTLGALLFLVGVVAYQHFAVVPLGDGAGRDGEEAAGRQAQPSPALRAAASTSAAGTGEASGAAGFAGRVGAYVGQVVTRARQTLSEASELDVAALLTPSSARTGEAEDGFRARVSDYSSDITTTVAESYRSAVGTLSRSFGFGMPETDTTGGATSQNPFRDTDVMDFSQGAEGAADVADISGLDADRRLKTDAENAGGPAAGVVRPQAAADAKVARLNAPQVAARAPLARVPAEGGPTERVRPVARPPRFDIVSFDADGEGVAAGEGEPHWRVSIMSAGRELADAVVDAQGRWVILFDKPLAPGNHRLTLVARPPDGAADDSWKVPSRQAVDVRFAARRAGKGGKVLPYVAISEPNKVVRVLQRPRQGAGRLAGGSSPASAASHSGARGAAAAGTQARVAAVAVSGKSVGGGGPAQVKATAGAAKADAREVHKGAARGWWADGKAGGDRRARAGRSVKAEQKAGQPAKTGDESVKVARVRSGAPDVRPAKSVKADGKRIGTGERTGKRDEGARTMAKAEGRPQRTRGEGRVPVRHSVALPKPHFAEKTAARKVAARKAGTKKVATRRVAARRVTGRAEARVVPPVMRDRGRPAGRKARSAAMRKKALGKKAQGRQVRKKRVAARRGEAVRRARAARGTRAARVTKGKAARKRFVVRSGDSLWSIAKKFYGDGAKFELLSRANNLKRPYKIYPDQVLIIPRNVRSVRGPSSGKGRRSSG